MHTARVAIRAPSEPRSASLTQSTVSIPSFSHVRITRTAISPRLAMRMRLIVTSSVRPHEHQHFAVLDHLAVDREHLDHLAGDPGARRVHQLHHLDDAHHGIRLDPRADLDERWLARL